MTKNAYKTRVEISIIFDVNVDEATSDEDAGATAETVGADIAAEMVRVIEESGYFVANYGIRAVDVEKEEPEKKKFGVFVAHRGYCEIEAETEEQAKKIAETLLPGKISWNEEWEVTDIQVEAD